MIFQKRIGAWVRASAEALRLFPLFQRRSLLQYSSHRNYKSFRNAAAPRWFMQCTCFTPRPLLLLCTENATIFLPFLVAQRRDHLLDDDLDPFLRSCGFQEISKLQKIRCFWWLIPFFVSLQGAGHNDVELYNQYLERLRHFVSQELTNWHKAEATETASASATSNTNNQVSNNVVKNEPKSQDQTTNNTTTTATKTTTGNNTNTTTSSSSLSISNQDSADKTTKNNSEKFLWKR